MQNDTKRRIISTIASEEDIKNDDTLRPKFLTDYIGQKKAKEMMKVYIEAAKGRKEPVATARHITVYLCRKMTNDTQTKIGQFLGDRDHSTIVNSEDVITKRITSDSELNQTIETIKKKISPQ